MDLVGVVPKNKWNAWLKEGGCAGTKDTGKEWAWKTDNLRAVTKLQRGDRLYVVCNGRLRGYATITRVIQDGNNRHPMFSICRRGDAVAVTIDEKIPVFRSLRKRWWEREKELDFPGWKKI